MGKDKFYSRTFLLSCTAVLLGACGGGSQNSSSVADSSIPNSESSSSNSSSSKSSPSFSKAAYSYDKNCGLDMELPLQLFRANLYYASLDGNQLDSSSFSYDEGKECLVIKQIFLISLEKKSYELSIVTDAEVENQASAVLTIMNSIVTSFDSEPEKTYGYGKDQSISFAADFSSANIVSIKSGERTIDASLYGVDDGQLTIKSEAFDLSYGTSVYTITLSNYDVYAFTIDSDVLFYSDYDASTINDTTESHYGANPLYQWADSTAEQIIDGTSYGFQGNVLKYTDNYINNDLNCHGFLTLKSGSQWPAGTWYDVGYMKDGNYFVSFDYETIGTSVGELAFKSWNSGYSTALPMGASNDGVVRHFETILSGEQVGMGTMLWASFIGGSGFVLVDNFRLVSLGKTLEIGTLPDFAYGSTDDYSFPVTSNGYYFSLLQGSDPVDYSFDSGMLTLPNSFMKSLSVGVHELTLKTLVGSFPIEIKVVDNSKAELLETSYDYKEGTAEEATLKGNFSEGVKISRLNEKAKTYQMDAQYTAQGWEFYHIDTAYDLSSLASVIAGENGTGGLRLSLDFLNKAFGTSSFEIEFSNGKTAEFVVTSDWLDVSDYDESTIWGSLNGTSTISSPFSSGMDGADYEIKEQATGDKACYIYSTEGCADACFYTFRTNPSHPWAWYTLSIEQNKLLRFRTNYIYKNLPADGAYFKVIVEKSLDVASNFFGSDYTIDTSNPAWNEVRFPLLNDGLEHILDTGYFAASAPWGVMQLHLPSFAKADDAYVMFDDYVMSETANPIRDLAYKKDGSPFSFPFSYQLQELSVGGKTVAFTQKDGTVSVSASEFQDIAAGGATIIAKTTVGAFQSLIDITMVGASLNETSKSFAKGQESVSLAGTFDGVSIVSATKSGSYDYDYSKTAPQALDISNFSLTSTSLSIGKGVLDYLYGDTAFAVTMNNGNVLSFTLTATGEILYDDFNNTTIWTTATGNVICCPDTSMVSFPKDDVTGKTYLFYEPSKASLSHANNNSLPYNGVLTCMNPSHNRYGFGWLSIPFEDDKTYTLSLSFTQNGASDDAYFAFYYVPVAGEAEVYERITANGTFTKDVKGSEIAAFCFLCKWANETARSAFNCRIDSFRISEKA